MIDFHRSVSNYILQVKTLQVSARARARFVIKVSALVESPRRVLADHPWI